MEESKNCLVGKFFHKMYVDDAGRTRIKNQGIVRDYFDGVLHVVDTSTVYEEEEESFKDIVFVIGVCGVSREKIYCY